MVSKGIPFQFDIGNLLKRARREFAGRVGAITLNLPFISIAVSPKDKEKAVARELVIRLQDRRVLSARECCDGCIDNALKSLREIRRILVDKQVELSEVSDGPLFFLIDAMALGIRQFATFEERLHADDRSSEQHPDFYRQLDARQAYFDGLEILRGHLSRCLVQIAAVAEMDAASVGLAAEYQGPWQLEAYALPALPKEGG